MHSEAHCDTLFSILLQILLTKLKKNCQYIVVCIVVRRGNPFKDAAAIPSLRHLNSSYIKHFEENSDMHLIIQ